MTRHQHAAAWASPEIGRSRLIGAGAQWLEARPWHLSASLTFRDPPGERAAMFAVLEWLARLSRAVGDHVQYVWSGQLSPDSGAHFHCLLLLPSVPSRDQARAIESSWRDAHGFARVERFEPGHGAGAYLLLHNDWEPGVACPRLKPDCRRTRGCREAKRAWK